MTNCPVNEEMRLWIEDSFLWLLKEFGEETFMKAKTLLPTTDDFHCLQDAKLSKADCIKFVIANNMDIMSDEIIIDFFDDHLLEIQSLSGHIIYTEFYEGQSVTNGLYLGKTNEGKHLIAIERKLVNEEDKLIATIAHEIAHIKIHGEGRLDINDEYLIDLVTIFFGLGFFTSSASFKTYSTFEKNGFSSQGYLSQQEWGYSLAIYNYLKKEITPSWIHYLPKNLLSDYNRSVAYILENTNKVLV